MASLQQLLTQEGFEEGNLPRGYKSTKSRSRTKPEDSIALPIYICHDRKSFDSSKKKAFSRSDSSIFSSKKAGSNSEKSVSKSSEPAIDLVAIRAVVSILSGYIGRYLIDETFREALRKKCFSCLERKNKDSDNGVFANLELVIQSTDKLVEDKNGRKKELRMKTSRNSIMLLDIVSSLNSKASKNGFTSGIPNSYLSACSQLYLSIVYKLEKNDRICARHLLQVFCDSPFLARTQLLPDLWEHFFLPHLLHLKAWHSETFEFLSNSESADKEKKMKGLSKAYNDQMDFGTSQFAHYYKEWLKVGSKAPTIPNVPLPEKFNYKLSRRRSLDSLSSNFSINKGLYQAVFGPNYMRQSMDLDPNGSLASKYGLEEQSEVHPEVSTSSKQDHVHSEARNLRKASSQNFRNPKAELWPEIKKTNSWLFVSCQSKEPIECMVKGSNLALNRSVRKGEKRQFLSSDLAIASTTICSSSSIEECEIAIRVIIKAWLDSNGDVILEDALSKEPVIEGILEVLFASNDDEILELAISILAELVTRKDEISQFILNSDPQLEIFIKLLRSSSLFLKASVLLYLLRPKAKQMVSMEWVPLVLRVLEFGDHLQTLFTIQSRPQVAAFYFLDQLLTGFDEGKNLENARQVVSHGGLSLLVKVIDTEDVNMRNNAASIIYFCIRADGSCRNYLSKTLNIPSVLELIVLGNQKSSNGCVFALLTELICNYRRTHVTRILSSLINEGRGLNIMHILLVYLQRAQQKERPLIAVILFQLDLLGDPSQCSIYREEVVEALAACLDCQRCSEEEQVQSARALLMLGGRFSYAGEASTENWILKEAGFDDNWEDSIYSSDMTANGYMNSNEEEEATESWQKKASLVLFTCGKMTLLASLSDAIVKGTPNFARASLVTISWMSRYLSLIEDEYLRSMAASVLMPQLIECLKYNRDLEERILASFSLLNLVKVSGNYLLTLSPEHDLMSLLKNLSLVTWTADELVSIIRTNSRNQWPQIEEFPA